MALGKITGTNKELTAACYESEMNVFIPFQRQSGFIVSEILSTLAFQPLILGETRYFLKRV
jgi:hypothetical protein